MKGGCVMRNKTLQVEKMLEIENWIESMHDTIFCDSISDEGLLKKLNLKLEYVNQDEFAPHTEAELCPCNDEGYFGLIRVNKKYINNRFAYMHEIIHYLLDVGLGKRVEKVFSRKTRGNTADEHEQEVNYATAAAILKYKDMKDAILEYDRSKPKMDELLFVRNICKKYNQETTTVIRRVKEVRTLMKKRMANY